MLVYKILDPNKFEKITNGFRVKVVKTINHYLETVPRAKRFKYLEDVINSYTKDLHIIKNGYLLVNGGYIVHTLDYLESTGVLKFEGILNTNGHFIKPNSPEFKLIKNIQKNVKRQIITYELEYNTYQDIAMDNVVMIEGKTYIIEANPEFRLVNTHNNRRTIYLRVKETIGLTAKDFIKFMEQDYKSIVNKMLNEYGVSLFIPKTSYISTNNYMLYFYKGKYFVLDFDSETKFRFFLTPYLLAGSKICTEVSKREPKCVVVKKFVGNYYKYVLNSFVESDVHDKGFAELLRSVDFAPSGDTFRSVSSVLNNSKFVEGASLRTVHLLSILHGVFGEKINMRVNCKSFDDCFKPFRVKSYNSYYITGLMYKDYFIPLIAKRDKVMYINPVLLGYYALTETIKNGDKERVFKFGGVLVEVFSSETSKNEYYIRVSCKNCEKNYSEYFGRIISFENDFELSFSVFVHSLE